MTRTFDRRAYRFFAENAGGIVGERALYAARLARAEASLRMAEHHERARVRWEWDDSPDLSWMTDEERAQPHECLVALLEVRCGQCEAWTVKECMGGIVDADRDYVRIIEAELACEAGFGRTRNVERGK